MIRRKKLLVGIGVALLLVSVLAASTVFAETPAPGSSNAQPNAPRQNYGQVFLSKLATILGVSQDQLTSAIKQAGKDTVDEAAKDGKLTEAQAERAKERIDKGGLNLFGQFVGPKLKAHAPKAKGFVVIPFQQNTIKVIADELGMSVGDLHNELRSGKSLSDIAGEKNLSLDDLVAAAVDAAKAKLDPAVEAGKLTQAQADKILERIKQAPLGAVGPKGFLNKHNWRLPAPRP